MHKKYFDLLKHTLERFLSATEKKSLFARVVKSRSGDSSLLQVMTAVGGVVLDVEDADVAPLCTLNPNFEEWGKTASLASIFKGAITTNNQAVTSLMDAELSEVATLWDRQPYAACPPTDYPEGSILLATAPEQCLWARTPSAVGSPHEAAFRRNEDTVSGVFVQLSKWASELISSASDLQPLSCVAIGALNGMGVLRAVSLKNRMVVTMCGAISRKECATMSIVDRGMVRELTMRSDYTFELYPTEDMMKTKVVDPTVLMGAAAKEPIADTAQACITVDATASKAKEEPVAAEATPAVTEAPAEPCESVQKAEDTVEVTNEADKADEQSISNEADAPVNSMEAAPTDGDNQTLAEESAETTENANAIEPEEVKDCMTIIDALEAQAINLESAIKSLKADVRNLKKLYKTEQKSKSKGMVTSEEFSALQAENKKLSAKLKNLTDILNA